MQTTVQSPLHFGSFRRRRGMAMITAMTSVLVAATITIGMARAVLTEQRELERRERLSQADVYAQAGFDRAAALLRQDAQRQQIPDWSPEFKNQPDKVTISYSLQNGSRTDSKIVAVIAEISNPSGISVRSYFQGEIARSSPPREENSVPPPENDAGSN